MLPHYLRAMIYPLIRDLLFRFDAEEVHYFSMNMLRSVCSTGAGRAAVRRSFGWNGGALEKEYWGLRFRNPVGLGAGFDKNALYLRELDALGFGFVEVGTVTPKPQAGNDKPRLFRLPADKAIINRMGFNNDGLDAVKQRLAAWKEKTQTQGQLVVGGNIGKNKVTPNEDAWKDYITCFKGLFGEADYFVVNVSSPNTPGLRELQEKDALYKILSELQSINQGKPTPKPLLLKIAPDLTREQVDDIISLAHDVRLSGLVATNTTISREGLSESSAARSREIGMGGLSGRPVKEKATEIVAYISGQTKGTLPIIASGGIFTGEDAKEKIHAGASLVQVWTGFIYEGPSIVKNICRHLTL
ncbi:MAG TPA: quinone-dependent dihydroorotate dehydrogenase [Sediminibacterium sp.]